MTAQEKRMSDYTTSARAAALKVWEGFNELKALQPEWNAQNYSSTLADGVGENEGINKAHVGAVVFDTANALETLFNTGHATNLTNAK